MLSLASSAGYEISGTRMQEQPTPSLQGSASHTPQGSQSALPSGSAALSSTRGTKQHLWEGLTVSKTQSYCVTPTLCTQKFQFWSNKDTFHFSKPSNPWKTTYPKQKSLQQQEPNNRWFQRVCCYFSNSADWASQVLKWSKPTQFIPGGSNTSSTAFPKETKTGSSLASFLKDCRDLLCQAQVKQDSMAESNYSG